MGTATGSRVGLLRVVGQRLRFVGPLLLALVGIVALVAAIGSRGAPVTAGALAQAAGSGVSYGGQLVPGDQPSVTVLGNGEASAPAETATIQLIVRALDGGAPAPGSDVVPVPAGQPRPVSEEEMAPIVEAIVGSGVTARDVEVVTSPGFGGPFGPGTAQVLVELDRAEIDLAEGLVEAGIAAAGENGLFVETVGAGYRVSDCAPLQREARQAAAADARERAEALAEVLGLRLGEIVLANESPLYDGGPSGFGCSQTPTGPGGGGVYFPPFNPAGEPEVEVYAQMNLAFAIG